MLSFLGVPSSLGSYRVLYPRYAMYYEFETRGVFSGYTAAHFGPESEAHMRVATPELQLSARSCMPRYIEMNLR